MNTTTNGRHYSGQQGVTWDATHQCWKVMIRKGDSLQVLGNFPDEALDRAIALRQEAEQTPLEGLYELRLRYGLKPRKDKSKGLVPITPPGDVADRLSALWRAALAADDELKFANGEASRAAGRAHAAEEDSIAAWNALAEALAEAGRNLDSGFIRSRLSFLLDGKDHE